MRKMSLRKLLQECGADDDGGGSDIEACIDNDDPPPAAARRYWEDTIALRLVAPPSYPKRTENKEPVAMSITLWMLRQTLALTFRAKTFLMAMAQEQDHVKQQNNKKESRQGHQQGRREA